jgi:hypothetical protein
VRNISKIYNTIGKLVMHGNKTMYDISSFPPEIYLVKAAEGTTVKILK